VTTTQPNKRLKELHGLMVKTVNLKHEVRLGNPDGDIVECVQDSNENTFINDVNIYEKWHCDVFKPCR